MEIIVVDDGSTDNSRGVAAQFGNQIRYIWQENQGLAGARNTGINAANGELVALLDADDEWDPNFLEEMVRLATQQPSAGLFYCCARAMDEDGAELPQRFGGPPVLPETMYETLLRANFLIPSTIVMRRSVVIAAGLFDMNLRSCEDWDLWLRLLPEHTFMGTRECLVRYRLHGGSLSANPGSMRQATLDVIKKHFGPDDGQWHTWCDNKRRAYGGVYRYHLLTLLQRQNDWQASATYLQKALQVDRTLAIDLDLFYELALGAQPSGYRGTSHQLDLAANSRALTGLLKRVFDSPSALEVQPLSRQTHGTANYALGLVAYNVGQRPLSRHFLFKALLLRPDLCGEQRVVGNLIKSFVGRQTLEWLKRHRPRTWRAKLGFEDADGHLG